MPNSLIVLICMIIGYVLHDAHEHYKSGVPNYKSSFSLSYGAVWYVIIFSAYEAIQNA